MKTNKKKMMIMAMVAMMFLGNLFPMKAEAVTVEERTYFIVTSGIAEKLGTSEVEKITNGDSYLEEWIATKEGIEGFDKKNTLLNANNKSHLPVSMEEVTYEKLMDLAKITMNNPNLTKIYQGYAMLNLKEAKEGYTYAVATENVKEGIHVLGYYVDLEGNCIYKIDLICKEGTLKAIASLGSRHSGGSNHSSSSSSESSSGSNSVSNSKPVMKKGQSKPSNPTNSIPGATTEN